MDGGVIGLDAAIEALGRTYEALAFPGDERDMATLASLEAFHERLRVRLLSGLPLPTREEALALREEAPGAGGVALYAPRRLTMVFGSHFSVFRSDGLTLSTCFAMTLK